MPISLFRSELLYMCSNLRIISFYASTKWTPIKQSTSLVCFSVPVFSNRFIIYTAISFPAMTQIKTDFLHRLHEVNLIYLSSWLIQVNKWEINNDICSGFKVVTLPPKSIRTEIWVLCVYVFFFCNIFSRLLP